MNFIRAIAASISALALAGCAHTSINAHAGTPGGGVPASGGSYSSAAIHVQASPNAYFGALLLGAVAVGVHDTYVRAGAGPATREPPQLDAERSIVERDCSVPMDRPSANLRCK